MKLAALACLALLPSAAALPSVQIPSDIAEGVARGDYTQAAACSNRYAQKPSKKYEVLQTGYAPRIQWNDAGGYCGSLSIQSTALGRGVYLSEQQIRNHAPVDHGHDSEILATNAPTALNNLKFKWSKFDYDELPTPQADAYRGWIKEQVLAGNGVFWLIMLRGGQYPVYPGLPYGYYSHVEPVFGVLTDHPLNDTKWYDDDIIAHGSNADLCTYFRRFDTLVGTVNSRNQSVCDEFNDYLGSPCIYEQYGFGFAIEGPNDGRTDGARVSLSVDKPTEPDTRAGQKPSTTKGTVYAMDLEAGATYAVWRWNTVDAAYTYEDKSHIVHTFTAAGAEYVWADPTPIATDSATYYRVLKL